MNEYYIEISQDKYNDTQGCYFSKSDKKTIMNIFKVSNYDFEILKTIKTEVFRIDDGYIDIEMYPAKDEWYYIYHGIRSNCTYYRCDQIDGLVECLKELDRYHNGKLLSI